MIHQIPLLTCLLSIIAGTALSVDPEWKLDREIPAEEAYQAAACDMKHFYAISSDKITKHDRENGQLIATSTGKAKHLNSGHMWEGKLYCAHSNFPRIPEKSEVMVLDPETMKLTTHHEFGNYGGSLTWIIRFGNGWLANFARYGAENKNTFLVEFDNDWNEEKRYTYPAELINQLGSYSVSGGTMWKDVLIVSGHDKPEVYQLRFPPMGNEMNYIRKHKVPFPGQGFDLDPFGGGLIGINRKERKIIVTKLAR